MKRELAKVLLDEIVRTRVQLVRLRMVLAREVEERSGRMDRCKECDRLWEEYRRATIESVQLDAEVRSMTERPRSSEVQGSGCQGRSCRAATGAG